MIKVGIIVDPVGNVEDDYRKVKADLDAGGFMYEVVCQTDMGAWQVDSIRANVLVVDFGGMVYGAQETAASNIRHCYQWACLYPGRILAIWTSQTFAILENDLGHEAIRNLPANVWIPGRGQTLAEFVKEWFCV